MHNEGAPRHHAGAPGPLLYLKPRSQRVRRRAQRIRSPGPVSPEKPPPREAREPLPGRAEFLVLPAPPGKGSRELGEAGVAAGGGGGDAGVRAAGRRAAPRREPGSGAMLEPAAFPASAASFSSRWRCPSHCISALIQLNHTRRGPALEDCDCAQDENCKSTKRAIEPCLPRTSGGGAGGAGAGGVMGCTEARRRCDRDSRCNLALGRYLTYCGKLFNGLRCTDECRTVIEDMLAVPKAALLNDCVCDGLERPICESVKENMARLCFGAELGNGPGSSGSDGGLDDYYDEDYEDEPRAGGAGGEQLLDDDDGAPHPARPGGGAAAAGGRGDLPYGPGRRSSGGARTALASILLLLLPLLF
uniref:Growth arrest specific 1 n=2 Tax=Canis lupus familiaris TaxID=9615 RepID=A0A8P0PHV0_CANLF